MATTELQANAIFTQMLMYLREVLIEPCVCASYGKAGRSMSGQVAFAAKTLDRADTSSLIAQQTDGIFIIDCIQSLNYNSYKIYIYIYYKLYKLRR